MNIIEEYLKYTCFSESPQAYHKWGCLSTIAGIIGKKCWIEFNYFTTYPNIYIILVSLPGVGRKSTTIAISEAMVRESEALINIKRDSLTPQALMIDMAEAYVSYEAPDGTKYGSSPLTIYSNELLSLLNSGMGMVEFLTDIYDSKDSWEYKTKNKGSLIVDSPCLNVIGCMTTDVFASKILREAVAGGFMSRSVIVYANDMKPISPFQKPTGDALAARQRVIDRFSEIKNIYGEVLFTVEAKDIYEDWYLTEFAPNSLIKKNMEFKSRKHIHVAKAAMLIAIGDLTTTIQLKHLTQAFELLDEVEHYMRLVHMASGGSKYSESQLKLLASINTFGEVTEKELLSVYMGDMTLEEFKEQIELMLRVEFVTVGINKDEETCLRITPKGTEIFLNYG